MYTSTLVLENLFLGESKVLESTNQLTLISRRNLGTRDGVVQRRRSTDEDVDVVGRRSKHVCLQVSLGNETSLTLPVRTSLVDKEVELELVGVLLLNGQKLILQQNIILRNTSVKEVNLGLVFGVLANTLNQLEQRSDTGATSNESNLLVLVGSPRVLGDGSLERNVVIDAEAKDVVAKLSGGVSLNNELEAAGNLKVGNRCVWSNNVVALCSDVFGQKRRGEGKAENRVVRQFKGEFLGLF